MTEIHSTTTPEARRRRTSAAQQLADLCQHDEARALRVARLVAQGATIARAIKAVRMSDQLLQEAI